MHSVKQLHQIVNEAIAQSVYPEQPNELYEPLTYFMGLGGKRIRPILLLMAYELFANTISKAIKPAVGIELFHNFTLMHDDIMDCAPLRRGKPTVHEKWSNTTAILSGDVMLIEAYKLMMQVDAGVLPNVLQVFNNTAVEVCEGQQLDMSFEKIMHITADQYIHMIRQKTAVLLAGALKIGAIIGGAPLAEADLLYTFGENIGIAFQLQDDILDTYGDPQKFGKQVGGDILSNKKTFMLIKAQELASSETKQQLEHILTSTNSVDKVEKVTAIYNQLNIKELAEATMDQFVNRALIALDKLNVDQEKKHTLKYFTDQLAVREY